VYGREARVHQQVAKSLGREAGPVRHGVTPYHALEVRRSNRRSSVGRQRDPPKERQGRGLIQAP
jgi:hypothetical protein